MSKKTSKGFTLIELLVVIAIIAVLSIVVILTLNPAELLRQARDSNRISDLATLKSAISLYLADVSTPFLGTSTIGYADSFNSVTGVATSVGSFSATFPSTPAVTSVATSATARAVNGTGWIPINFNLISSGAPVSQLPVDPLGNDQLHIYLYRVASTTLTFKIAAKMESSKYSYPNGASNVESTDGGTKDTEYETGTNLQL